MDRETFEPSPLADVEVAGPDTDGRWTLVFVRDLRHPPERVWAALTDPAQLGEWAPFLADRDLGTPGDAVLTMVDGDTAEPSPATVAGPSRRRCSSTPGATGPAPLGARGSRDGHPADPAAHAAATRDGADGDRRLAHLPRRRRAAARRRPRRADPRFRSARLRMGRPARRIRREAGHPWTRGHAGAPGEEATASSEPQVSAKGSARLWCRRRGCCLSPQRSPADVQARAALALTLRWRTLVTTGPALPTIDDATPPGRVAARAVRWGRAPRRATRRTTSPACRGTRRSTSDRPPSPTPPPPRRSPTSSGAPAAPGCASHRRAPGTTPVLLGPLGDVVLLRTAAMQGVTVDPVTRTARVAAGVLWQDAVEAAAEHGLATLHGSSPDVGVVGYSLGGGIGWYARQLGMQANNVTAVELVTADGDQVRADADHETDLFWALRGGGGNFGVVTALEFAVHDVGRPFAGMMVWDASRAAEVLDRWTKWSGCTPDEATTALRIVRVPDAAGGRRAAARAHARRCRRCGAR